MKDKKIRVIIAEDNEDIVDVLRLYLQNEGYEIISASNGKEALSIINNQHFDIGLFDIMMPEMDGYQLIQEVRKNNNMPIIIISAKKEDNDKIIGLNIGADDYLVKPFNPLEVVARVNSAIRRFYVLNENNDTDDDERTDIVVGNIKLDHLTFKLYKNDREIIVTATEFKILSMLMSTPGRVYTKAQIYERLNGELFINDENTITVHISNIRNKLEDDSKNPKYLVTVRGLGYKFVDGK